MAKPVIKSIQKESRKRSKMVINAEDGLLDKAASLERKLNNYVINTFMPSLDISDGRIKNTSANLKKINKSTGLRRFLRTVINAAMYEYYEKQFNSLTGQTNKYFNVFEPTDSLRNRITNKGEIITSSFLDNLFDNNDIFKSLQNTIKNGATTSMKTSDLSLLLTEQIKGKEEKFGLIKSYHYKNGMDEFQSYSRTLDDNFSKSLNLNYAIYAGGEIITTRPFCDERNGNVYNREEILSWNHSPITWKGRKENNNILIDMGGYNCRHNFDWISYALAKRIQPDITKSEFDKK